MWRQHIGHLLSWVEIDGQIFLPVLMADILRYIRSCLDLIH